MPGQEPTPVTRDAFAAADLPGWTWRDEPTPALVGGFRAADFTGAARFALAVAEAADAQAHHPDIDVRYQRHCRVVLTTHRAGGVSDLDLHLAATIDRLAGDCGVEHDDATPR